ncbi:MAG: peptidoglycan DD-metalloendopeptidase family protein, partial [Gammaproteobacteria bacterium]|nr:peptidoglycan DD-metalloendopeptidase family protein [Gammaproteobacteria bacterium]
GFGNLVIVKHGAIFLSAYAHNQEILVKEGEKVLAGQQIASMGSTGSDRVSLYFEIRENGEPVDPLQYLKTPK